MTSRTQLIEFVTSLRWKDVASALAAQAELIAFTAANNVRTCDAVAAEDPEARRGRELQGTRRTRRSRDGA